MKKTQEIKKGIEELKAFYEKAIELKDKIISLQNERIRLLEKEIKHLEVELSNEANSKLLYPYELLLEIFLIQERRKLLKKENAKLRNISDFEAIYIANKRLKSYSPGELFILGTDKPTKLCETLQTTYSKYHKPKFKKEIGPFLRYLKIDLATD